MIKKIIIKDKKPKNNILNKNYFQKILYICFFINTFIIYNAPILSISSFENFTKIMKPSKAEEELATYKSLKIELHTDRMKEIFREAHIEPNKANSLTIEGKVISDLIDSLDFTMEKKKIGLRASKKLKQQNKNNEIHGYFSAILDRIFIPLLIESSIKYNEDNKITITKGAYRTKLIDKCKENPNIIVNIYAKILDALENDKQTKPIFFLAFICAITKNDKKSNIGEIIRSFSKNIAVGSSKRSMKSLFIHSGNASNEMEKIFNQHHQMFKGTNITKWQDLQHNNIMELLRLHIKERPFFKEIHDDIQYALDNKYVHQKSQEIKNEIDKIEKYRNAKIILIKTTSGIVIAVCILTNSKNIIRKFKQLMNFFGDIFKNKKEEKEIFGM